MSKYKIISKNNTTKMFIDNKEVEHLKSIEFSHKSSNDLPTLKIEVYVLDEIEINTDNTEFISTLDKKYEIAVKSL